MRTLLKIFVISLYANIVTAQSMTEILQRLPRDYFREVQLDSLIKNKTYLPASNDDESAVRYQLTDLDEAKGILRVEMVFTTPQRAFAIHELRKYKLSQHEYLIMYVETNGTPAVFGQSLEFFTITKGLMNKSNTTWLPEDLDVKQFFKSDTPDFIIEKVRKSASLNFWLFNYGDHLACVLSSTMMSFDEYTSYMLGDTIDFVFENGHFSMSKPRFWE